MSTSSIRDINPSNTLIIHPGSLFVRIGYATDVNPYTVLHAIARKRKPGGIIRVDSMLPAALTASMTKHDKKCMDDAKQAISGIFQSQIETKGKKRQTTTLQQIANFNRYVTGQKKNPSGGEWHYSDDEFIVGDEILNLDPNLPYNVHFPFHRGELNINDNVSGSLVAVLDDLRTIWSHIICYHLELDLRILRKYRVVLVIPDIFNRVHATQLVNLLLHEMKFSACFLIQDHVAATFGAGLSAACIVDVGHSKLSISCVEDAVSIPRTRVRIGYGGADITQVFHWILQKCDFPYRNCNPSSSKADAFLFQKLKHDYCRVNMEVSGISETTIIVRQPKHPVYSYTLQMGDECMIPVLGMFYPGLFAITGPKSTISHSRATGNYEDFFDEDYLQEITRRHKDPTDGSFIGNDGLDDIVVDNSTTDANNSKVSGCSEFLSADGNPLGLDQAIIRSIERCGSQDQKRKFYGCILLIGGGIKFRGMKEFMRDRIQKQILTAHVNVYMSLKDVDSENTSWKGAAVTAVLETAQELWIQPNEWTKCGSRLLREKSLVTW